MWQKFLATYVVFSPVNKTSISLKIDVGSANKLRSLPSLKLGGGLCMDVVLRMV